MEDKMNNDNLIIVAEDDDEIADILISYLQRAGMKTFRAGMVSRQLILLACTNQTSSYLISICLFMTDGMFLQPCAKRVTYRLSW